MTPEEARELLDGTTPGKAIATDANPEDAPLITAAPDMAATIAGMTTEYRVVALDKNGNRDFDLPAIYQTGEEAETRINHIIDNLKGCFRIEKRTVTEWEVME